MILFRISGPLAAVVALLALAGPSYAGHQRAHGPGHLPGCWTARCDWWAEREFAHRWELEHAPSWAIPWAIVRCESKGVNLPPNSATAAGYYQITAGTWPEGGGSPPNDASKHSRREQDRVAARLWAGGAGSGRWKECGG